MSIKKIISHFSHRSSNFDEGFTLIEAIIVMGVFIVIGMVSVSVLVSALRVANKANTIAAARQNGNYAVAQMAKMIRNARKFDGIKNNASDTATPCGSGTNWSVKNGVQITSFDGENTFFQCLTDNTNIASTSASKGTTINLLNDSEVAIVPLSCFFSCLQNTSSPPIVRISFKLKQVSTTGFSEKQAEIPFRTSVQIRNWK